MPEFSALLRDAGIDPRDVKVLRHTLANLDLLSVWKEDRPAFETYQSIQRRDRAAHFERRFWASCIALKDGRTVFVGMYRPSLRQPLPAGTVDRLGSPSSYPHDWYGSEPVDLMSEFAGRLVLDWGNPRTWVQNGEAARNAQLLDAQAIDQGDDGVARNPPWSRDELILALDLYMTNPTSPPGKNSQAVHDLSGLLNALGRQLHEGARETYRNPNGVYMKMMNFRRFDPEVTASGKVGLKRGNKDEEVVWEEFSENLTRLAKVAGAIRRAIVSGNAEPSPAYDDGDEVVEALEGRVLTRLHRTRERNRKLIDAKKAKELQAKGRLACEVCDFEFAKRYGARGANYIEVHHTKPLHTLPEGGTTRLADLALVCANCHRMIHSSRRWLTIEELRELVDLD